MKHTELMESKSHGTPGFPIQYYYIDSTHPQYTMPAHWHREFEIIRVISGSFSVYLNNIPYQMERGDILFVECGCLHRGLPQECVYECIVFNPNMLISIKGGMAEKYITDIAESAVGVNCLLNSENGGIYSATASLFATMAKKKLYYELEIHGILFKIFSLLYSESFIISNAKSQHSRRTDTVIGIINFIEENYRESITLDMLSENAGLSRKYLCRLFKEYTSKTVTEYINGLRTENACYEMAVKHKSVTEAAFDSGFNDLSYFCKTFKKLKGVTAKKYAEKNRIR